MIRHITHMVSKLLLLVSIWVLPASPLAAQPVAHDDAFVAIENSSLQVFASELLANDETFPYEPTVDLASSPQSGQLAPVIKDGYLYTPNADFFGNDAFTYTVTTQSGTSAPATVALWTAPERLVFAGNWNGDGQDIAELAWLDNTTGRLFLCDGNRSPITCTRYTTTLPVAGRDPLAFDWDGDGVDEVALFDPATGTFALTEFSMTGGEGTLTPAGTVVVPEAIGQRPLAGDWDDDGADTIGLYEPATGRFRLRDSNAPGPFDHDFVISPPADGLPISGDWDGLNGDSVAVYDRSTGTFHLSDDNATGAVSSTFTTVAGRIPVSGRWAGGGRTFVGIYDRTNHLVELYLDPLVIKPRPVQIPEDPDPG